MAEPAQSIFDHADPAAEDAADARAEADLAAGRIVSYEAIRDWLLSWGRSDETPPPPLEG